MTHNSIAAETQYRRGAIMGLTLAETFIIVAFALLLLLWLWYADAEQKMAALRAQLAPSPETIARAVEEPDRLTDRERGALMELTHSGAIDWVRDLRSIGLLDIGEAQRLQAIEIMRQFGDRDFERLIEIVTIAPAEERRRLIELAERPVEPPEVIALARELLAEGVVMTDVREALTVAAAVEEANVSDIEELRSRIRRRIDAGDRRAGDLATAMEAALGPVVARVGGRIDETGAIILPDDLLFELGSARLTPSLIAFLNEVCVPWIDTLRSLDFEISEMRIEGHTSSEWGNAQPKEAYFRNLGLSQQRAAAVLRACLERVYGTAAGAWAQRRATAVGYSSSRPIHGPDSREDNTRSRRVVLSAAIPAEDVIEAIEWELKTTPGSITNRQKSMKND